MRRDRRPGLPLESALTFYPRYAWGVVAKLCKAARMYRRYVALRRELTNDPEAANYTDTALGARDAEELELFTITPAAQQAAPRRPVAHSK